MKLNQEFDFQDYLINNTKGYTGKYAEFILLLPDLYSLLCKLLDSKDLPIQLRADIYLVIGYLYHPQDIFSEEEHGPLGFLDDLMLILTVLRKCAIQEELGMDYIKKFADGMSIPFEKLLTTDFKTLTNENKILFDELLSVTGMQFYYKSY
jgi:uncharacterized membrane protein YkvA (DUF1232 family)